MLSEQGKGLPRAVKVSVKEMNESEPTDEVSRQRNPHRTFRVCSLCALLFPPQSPCQHTRLIICHRFFVHWTKLTQTSSGRATLRELRANATTITPRLGKQRPGDKKTLLSTCFLSPDFLNTTPHLKPVVSSGASCSVVLIRYIQRNRVKKK